MNEESGRLGSLGSFLARFFFGCTSFFAFFGASGFFAAGFLAAALGFEVEGFAAGSSSLPEASLDSEAEPSSSLPLPLSLSLREVRFFLRSPSSPSSPSLLAYSSSNLRIGFSDRKQNGNPTYSSSGSEPLDRPPLKSSSSLSSPMRLPLSMASSSPLSDS